MKRRKNPSGTQEERVLKALQEAQNGDMRGFWVEKDGWLNKQYFIRTLGLTQAGRAIWNLEHEMKVDIEHSEGADEFGFKSYRLRPGWKPKPPADPIIIE